MSYMNHLEKKMRYSNAFSSLNSLRNSFEFGNALAIDIEDKTLILDAIEIAIDATEESYKKALMFGFYNTGDTLKASALELAYVLNEGVEKNVITQTELNTLRNSLIQNSFEQELFENPNNLTKKIDNLMILLSKAKKENVSETNMLLIKNFNITNFGE
jgi:hypothetical protein